MKTLFTTPEIYFCNTTAFATETLFRPTNGRTASGTFKKLKNQIRFFDLSGKLFAALVKNRHDEIMLVTAADTGKGIFYSFALSTADEKRLGLSGLSYSEKKELEEKLWETAADL
jgi:hypothetical protein